MTNCAEQSGFLFPHPCGRLAIQACSRCAKPICAQHTIADRSGNLHCITCAQDAQTSVGWADDDVYLSSPYFYHRHHYPRYHDHAAEAYDPHDFTEGDQAALTGQEGAGGGGDFGPDTFEDDMGGS
jgi:hypothetical protein